MKIGIFDGSINFDSGSIQPKQDRTSFLTTRLGQMGKEEVVNEKEDWRHIGLMPEPGIGATLIFQGERLHQVFVDLTMPADGTNDWTEANEIKRKAKHDAWLRSELGAPPYQYAWGRIASVYDEKGCASTIVVTYAR
jgi:hypothetical protein